MPLGKKADAGDYVDDFKKSKAPQFKVSLKRKEDRWLYLRIFQIKMN